MDSARSKMPPIANATPYFRRISDPENPITANKERSSGLQKGQVVAKKFTTAPVIPMEVEPFIFCFCRIANTWSAMNNPPRRDKTKKKLKLVQVKEILIVLKPERTSMRFVNIAKSRP